MKHLKLVAKICEILLFFLMGNLVRMAFLSSLDFVDKLLLISCVIVLVLYISIRYSTSDESNK